MKFTKKIPMTLALIGCCSLSACLFDKEIEESKTIYPDSKVTPEGFNGPVSGTVEEGHSSLAKGLGEMMNTSESQITSAEGVSSMNMVEIERAYSNYQEVLESDSENNDAKFGMAISRFALAFQTEAVNEMVDQISGTDNAAFSMLNLNGKRDFSPLARKLARSEAPSGLPRVDEVQSVIDEAIITALDESIQYLEEVRADKDFVTTLTIDGQTMSMGYSEASVMQAGFITLRAYLTFWLAWDFNFDQDGSYDFIDILANSNPELTNDGNNFTTDQINALNFITERLSLGSSFFTVRSGWKDRLANVDNELGNALSITKSALIYRSDNENFVINNQNIDDVMASEMIEVLDSLIKYSHQPLEVDLGEAGVISFDFKKIFEIDDAKKMMPYYEFYEVQTWSESQPIFYFTDASGNATANLHQLSQDLDVIDTEEAGIEYLKSKIIFQDPSMGGVFPGMTQDKIWHLIEHFSQTNDVSATAVDQEIVYYEDYDLYN